MIFDLNQAILINGCQWSIVVHLRHRVHENYHSSESIFYTFQSADLISVGQWIMDIQ